MKAPSPGDIIIAVKVLEAFRDQLHIEAACSIIELPETSLGQNYARRIGSQTLEKSGRIEEVITRLNDWKDSLRKNQGVRV